MSKIQGRRQDNFKGKPPKNYWKKPQGPAAPEPGVLSLVTYNLKNMFDNVNADKQKGSTAKPLVEMRAAGKVVVKSGADVMTNQEVENKQIYDSWAADNLQGALPNSVLLQGNDKRGINVGLMTRYPIIQVITHKDEQFPLNDGSAMTQFRRDLLRVDLDVEGETISVYTTHLQSRRGGKADEVFIGDNQRIAEAKAIKEIVSREMKPYPGRLYIITGDLNDGTGNESVQALLNGPGDKLIDTLAGKPDAERMTWPSDPRNQKFPAEQFDHILIPESMKHRLIDCQVLDYAENTINASDHKPVRARFRVGPSATGAG